MLNQVICEGLPTRPRGARAIRRDIGERNASDTQLLSGVYLAISQLLEKSRAPLDVARCACQMMVDEIDDKRAHDTLSWDEGQHSTRRKDQYAEGFGRFRR